MRISSRISTRFRTTSCCYRFGPESLDRSVVKLISMWLKAGVMEENAGPDGNDRNTAGRSNLTAACESVPSLAGPILGKRKEFGKRPHDAHLVRYADDFVILCRERPEFYLEQAKQVLDRLGLALNEQEDAGTERPQGTFRLPRKSLRCAALEAHRRN
jgi:hypothetical protein